MPQRRLHVMCSGTSRVSVMSVGAPARKTLVFVRLLPTPGRGPHLGSKHFSSLSSATPCRPRSRAAALLARSLKATLPSGPRHHAPCTPPPRAKLRAAGLAPLSRQRRSAPRAAVLSRGEGNRLGSTARLGEAPPGRGSLSRARRRHTSLLCPYPVRSSSFVVLSDNHQANQASAARTRFNRRTGASLLPLVVLLLGSSSHALLPQPPPSVRERFSDCLSQHVSQRNSAPSVVRSSPISSPCACRRARLPVRGRVSCTLPLVLSHRARWELEGTTWEHLGTPRVHE